MKADFVVVADASPEIGMGHAVRMYALADAFMRAGKSVVYATRTPDYILDRLDLPCAVTGVSEDRTLVCDVLVADAPDGRLNFSHAVLFDDYGEAFRVNDYTSVVVHPHLTRPRFGAPTLYGPKWLPLRTVLPFASSGLYDNADVCLVRGDCPLEILKAISARTSIWPMEWDHSAIGNIAVVTASMTAYECMALGLPTLVYPQSEHHQPIADSMVKAGVALHYSKENLDRVLNDASLRRRLGETARTVVDGRGADRLARALIGMF